MGSWSWRGNGAGRRVETQYVVMAVGIVETGDLAEITGGGLVFAQGDTEGGLVTRLDDGRIALGDGVGRLFGAGQCGVRPEQEHQARLLVAGHAHRAGPHARALVGASQGVGGAL